jgi:hypothetical protein
MSFSKKMENKKVNKSCSRVGISEREEGVRKW